MNTLKWRLSFQTKSIGKQLKKLWSDYIHSQIPEASNNDAVILALLVPPVLKQFTESFIAGSSDQRQAALADELSDDIANIFAHTLDWFSRIHLGLKSCEIVNDVAVDDTQGKERESDTNVNGGSGSAGLIVKQTFDEVIALFNLADMMLQIVIDICRKDAAVAAANNSSTTTSTSMKKISTNGLSVNKVLAAIDACMQSAEKYETVISRAVSDGSIGSSVSEDSAAVAAAKKSSATTNMHLLVQQQTQQQTPSNSDNTSSSSSSSLLSVNRRIDILLSVLSLLLGGDVAVGGTSTSVVSDDAFLEDCHRNMYMLGQIDGFCKLGTLVTFLRHSAAANSTSYSTTGSTSKKNWNGGRRIATAGVAAAGGLKRGDKGSNSSSDTSALLQSRVMAIIRWILTSLPIASGEILEGYDLREKRRGRWQISKSCRRSAEIVSASPVATTLAKSSSSVDDSDKEHTVLHRAGSAADPEQLPLPPGGAESIVGSSSERNDICHNVMITEPLEEEAELSFHTGGAGVAVVQQPVNANNGNVTSIAYSALGGFFGYNGNSSNRNANTGVGTKQRSEGGPAAGTNNQNPPPRRPYAARVSSGSVGGGGLDLVGGSSGFLAAAAVDDGSDVTLVLEMLALPADLLADELTRLRQQQQRGGNVHTNTINIMSSNNEEGGGDIVVAEAAAVGVVLGSESSVDNEPSSLVVLDQRDSSITIGGGGEEEHREGEQRGGGGGETQREEEELHEGEESERVKPVGTLDEAEFQLDGEDSPRQQQDESLAFIVRDMMRIQGVLERILECIRCAKSHKEALDALCTLQALLWHDPVSVGQFERLDGYTHLSKMLNSVEEVAFSRSELAREAEEAGLLAAYSTSSGSNKPLDSAGSVSGKGFSMLRHYHPLTGSTAATESLNVTAGGISSSSTSGGGNKLGGGDGGGIVGGAGAGDTDEEEEEGCMFDILTQSQRSQYNDIVLCMVLSLIVEDYSTLLPPPKKYMLATNLDAASSSSSSSLSSSSSILDFTEFHRIPPVLPRGSVVDNTNALILLKTLAASPSSHLVTTSICASHALIKSNPLNIISLELEGVVDMLCVALTKLVLGDDDQARRKAAFHAVQSLNRRRSRAVSEGSSSSHVVVVNEDDVQAGTNDHHGNEEVEGDEQVNHHHGGNSQHSSYQEEATLGANQVVTSNSNEQAVSVPAAQLPDFPLLSPAFIDEDTPHYNDPHLDADAAKDRLTVVNSNYDPLPLVFDLSALLQVCAVITSSRDEYILHLLSQLSLSLSMSLAYSARGLESFSTNRPRSASVSSDTPFQIAVEEEEVCGTANIRLGWTCQLQLCQNCEIESAVYECFSKRCASDGKFILCRECDRVFHKPHSKQCHIRAPILRLRHVIRSTEEVPPVSLNEASSIPLCSSCTTTITNNYNNSNCPIAARLCIQKTRHIGYPKCSLCGRPRYCGGSGSGAGAGAGIAGADASSSSSYSESPSDGICRCSFAQGEGLDFETAAAADGPEIVLHGDDDEDMEAKEVRLIHERMHREEVQCVLLARVKGLIGDRRARGQKISQSLLVSSLALFRITATMEDFYDPCSTSSSSSFPSSSSSLPLGAAVDHDRNFHERCSIRAKKQYDIRRAKRGDVYDILHLADTRSDEALVFCGQSSGGLNPLESSAPTATATATPADRDSAAVSRDRDRAEKAKSRSLDRNDHRTAGDTVSDMGSSLHGGVSAYGSLSALDGNLIDTDRNHHRRSNNLMQSHRRIVMSLCLQTIARFFIDQRILSPQQAATTTTATTSATTMVDLIRSSEIASGIKAFRLFGLDALCAHLLTTTTTASASASSVVTTGGAGAVPAAVSSILGDHPKSPVLEGDDVLVTAVDKQFIVWMLREIVLAASEGLVISTSPTPISWSSFPADKSGKTPGTAIEDHARGILRWLIWLINSGIIEYTNPEDSSSSSSYSSSSFKMSDSVGIAKGVSTQLRPSVAVPPGNSSSSSFSAPFSATQSKMTLSALVMKKLRADEEHEQAQLGATEEVVFANLPLAWGKVSLFTRGQIVQEIRLLLGGGDWHPVSLSHSSLTSNTMGVEKSVPSFSPDSFLLSEGMFCSLSAMPTCALTIPSIHLNSRGMNKSTGGVDGNNGHTKSSSQYLSDAASSFFFFSPSSSQPNSAKNATTAAATSLRAGVIGSRVNNVAGSSSSLSYRVPLSSVPVKIALVELGVVESLLNAIVGDAAHPTVRLSFLAGNGCGTAAADVFLVSEPFYTQNRQLHSVVGKGGRGGGIFPVTAAASNASVSKISVRRPHDVSQHPVGQGKAHFSSAAKSTMTDRQPCEPASVTVEDLSELAAEDWWNSLITLGLMLRGCNEAKTALDSSYGCEALAEVLIPFTVANPAHTHAPLVRGTGPGTTNSETSISSSTLTATAAATAGHLPICSAIITQLLVEICITGASIAPPCAPFLATSCKLPSAAKRSQGLSNLLLLGASASDSSAHSNSVTPAATLTTRESPASSSLGSSLLGSRSGRGGGGGGGGGGGAGRFGANSSGGFLRSLTGGGRHGSSIATAPGDAGKNISVNPDTPMAVGTGTIIPCDIIAAERLVFTRSHISAAVVSSLQWRHGVTYLLRHTDFPHLPCRRHMDPSNGNVGDQLTATKGGSGYYGGATLASLYTSTIEGGESSEMILTTPSVVLSPVYFTHHESLVQMAGALNPSMLSLSFPAITGAFASPVSHDPEAGGKTLRAAITKSFLSLGAKLGLTSSVAATGSTTPSGGQFDPRTEFSKSGKSHSSSGTARVLSSSLHGSSVPFPDTTAAAATSSTGGGGMPSAAAATGSSGSSNTFSSSVLNLWGGSVTKPQPQQQQDLSQSIHHANSTTNDTSTRSRTSSIASHGTESLLGGASHAATNGGFSRGASGRHLPDYSSHRSLGTSQRGTRDHCGGDDLWVDTGDHSLHAHGHTPISVLSSEKRLSRSSHSSLAALSVALQAQSQSQAQTPQIASQRNSVVSLSLQDILSIPGRATSHHTPNASVCGDAAHQQQHISGQQQQQQQQQSGRGGGRVYSQGASSFLRNLDVLGRSDAQNPSTAPSLSSKYLFRSQATETASVTSEIHGAHGSTKVATVPAHQYADGVYIPLFAGLDPGLEHVGVKLMYLFHEAVLRKAGLSKLSQDSLVLRGILQKPSTQRGSHQRQRRGRRPSRDSRLVSMTDSFHDDCESNIADDDNDDDGTLGGGSTIDHNDIDSFIEDDIVSTAESSVPPSPRSSVAISQSKLQTQTQQPSRRISFFASVVGSGWYGGGGGNKEPPAASGQEGKGSSSTSGINTGKGGSGKNGDLNNENQRRRRPSHEPGLSTGSVKASAADLRVFRLEQELQALRRQLLALLPPATDPSISRSDNYSGAVSTGVNTVSKVRPSVTKSTSLFTPFSSSSSLRRQKSNSNNNNAAARTRHTSSLLPSNDAAADLHFPWHPPYSKIHWRSPQGAQLLISFMLTLAAARNPNHQSSSSSSSASPMHMHMHTQTSAGAILTTSASESSSSQMLTVLMSLLSNFLDANPANASMLSAAIVGGRNQDTTTTALSSQGQGGINSSLGESTADQSSGGEGGGTQAVAVLLCRLVPLLDDSSRSAFTYLLSQILRHHMPENALKELVDAACEIDGVSILSVIKEMRRLSFRGDVATFLDTHPEKKSTVKYVARKLPPLPSLCAPPAAALVRGSDSSAATGQVLYVVGRAAERTEPKFFLNFDQGDAISSRVLLPPITQIPAAGTGISLCSWIRIGALSEIPISTLCQISIPEHLSRRFASPGVSATTGTGATEDDAASCSSSSCASPRPAATAPAAAAAGAASPEPSLDAAGGTTVIDIFFRTVYKFATPSISTRDNTAAVAPASASVRQGSIATIGDLELDLESDFDLDAHGAAAAGGGGGGGANIGGDQDAANSDPANRGTKRVLQLCVSYGSDGLADRTTTTTDANHAKTTAASDKCPRQQTEDLDGAGDTDTESRSEWQQTVDSVLEHRNHCRRNDDLLLSKNKTAASAPIITTDHSSISDATNLSAKQEDSGIRVPSLVLDKLSTISQATTVIASTLTRFAVPDIIVDCDWAERGEWHLVCVTLSEDGVTCFVDGRPMAVLQWSALGYRRNASILASHQKSTTVKAEPSLLGIPKSFDSPSVTPRMQSIISGTDMRIHGGDTYQIPYPSNPSIDAPLSVSLGGLYYEASAFSYIAKEAPALQQYIGSFFSEHPIGKTNNAAVDKNGEDSEVLYELQSVCEQAQNDLLFLQSFQAIVGGYSGAIGDFVLFEGSPSAEQLLSCVRSGASFGLGPFMDALSTKKIAHMFPADLDIGGNVEACAGASSWRGGGGGRGGGGQPSFIRTQQRVREVAETVDAKGGEGGKRTRSGSEMDRSNPTPTNTPVKGKRPERKLSVNPLSFDEKGFNYSSEQQRSPNKGKKQQLSSSFSSSSKVTNLFNLFSEAAAAASAAVRSRRRDRTQRSPRNSDPSFTISSDVQLHHTKTVADAMASLGGLRLLYPLLVADCTRQVAALRIMGSLILSSRDTFQYFLNSKVDYVVAYCCHIAHTATTTESLQALFDLATSKALGRFPEVELTERGVSVSRPRESPAPYLLLSGQVAEQSATELICSPSLLSLLLDVAVATPYNAQLARVTIEWLRGVCDDVPENSSTVLQHVGVAPFLVLLSLWGIGGADVLFASNANEIGVSPASRDEVGSAKRRPLQQQQQQQQQSQSQLNAETNPPAKAAAAAGVFVLPALPPADCYRLQQSCARIIRQLITGTSGDQSTPAPNTSTVTSDINAPIMEYSASLPSRDALLLRASAKQSVPSSLVTPSGFSVQSLTSLMKFILAMHSIAADLFEKSRRRAKRLAARTDGTSASILRQSSDSVVNDAWDAYGDRLYTFTKPLVGVARPNSPDYRKHAKKPLQRKPSNQRGGGGGNDVPSNWPLNAALAGLDAVLGAADGPLASTLWDMLLRILPGNQLWFALLDLIGSPFVAVRERGLRLLLICFARRDGQLDPKQISSFEKIGGFVALASALSVGVASVVILDSLLALLFWRSARYTDASSVNNYNENVVGGDTMEEEEEVPATTPVSVPVSVPLSVSAANNPPAVLQEQQREEEEESAMVDQCIPVSEDENQNREEREKTKRNTDGDYESPPLEPCVSQDYPQPVEDYSQPGQHLAEIEIPPPSTSPRLSSRSPKSQQSSSQSSSSPPAATSPDASVAYPRVRSSSVVTTGAPSSLRSSTGTGMVKAMFGWRTDTTTAATTVTITTSTTATTYSATVSTSATIAASASATTASSSSSSSASAAATATPVTTIEASKTRVEAVSNVIINSRDLDHKSPGRGSTGSGRLPANTPGSPLPVSVSVSVPVSDDVRIYRSLSDPVTGSPVAADDTSQGLPATAGERRIDAAVIMSPTRTSDEDIVTTLRAKSMDSRSASAMAEPSQTQPTNPSHVNSSSSSNGSTSSSSIMRYFSSPSRTPRTPTGRSALRSLFGHLSLSSEPTTMATTTASAAKHSVSQPPYGIREAADTDQNRVSAKDGDIVVSVDQDTDIQLSVSVFTSGSLDLTDSDAAIVMHEVYDTDRLKDFFQDSPMTRGATGVSHSKSGDSGSQSYQAGAYAGGGSLSGSDGVEGNITTSKSDGLETLLSDETTASKSLEGNRSTTSNNISGYDRTTGNQASATTQKYAVAGGAGGGGAVSVSVSVEIIRVPQIIPAILAAVARAQTIDAAHSTVKALEASISVPATGIHSQSGYFSPSVLSHDAHDDYYGPSSPPPVGGRLSSYSSSSSQQQQLQKQIQQQGGGGSSSGGVNALTTDLQHNMSAFFGHKDWLLLISDSVLAYRRRLFPSEESSSYSQGGGKSSEDGGGTAPGFGSGSSIQYRSRSLISSGSDEDIMPFMHSRPDLSPPHINIHRGGGGGGGGGGAPGSTASDIGNTATQPETTAKAKLTSSGDVCDKDEERMKLPKRASFVGDEDDPDIADALINKFSAPLFSLAQSLLLLDMRLKPGAKRAWQDVLTLQGGGRGDKDKNEIQAISIYNHFGGDSSNSGSSSSSLSQTRQHYLSHYLSAISQHEDVQAGIMLGLLDLFEFYPYPATLNTPAAIETVLNVFKNMCLLLLAALSQSPLSLEFCVRAVQSMHALSYKCPPSIRERLNETSFGEARNAYVCRCICECSKSNLKLFLDAPIESFASRGDGKGKEEEDDYMRRNQMSVLELLLPGYTSGSSTSITSISGDISQRLSAVREIQPSLSRYVGTSEQKQLSDYQVLLLLMGLFMEAWKDLDVVHAEITRLVGLRYQLLSPERTTATAGVSVSAQNDDDDVHVLEASDAATTATEKLEVQVDVQFGVVEDTGNQQQRHQHYKGPSGTTPQRSLSPFPLLLPTTTTTATTTTTTSNKSNKHKSKSSNSIENKTPASPPPPPPPLLTSQRRRYLSPLSITFSPQKSHAAAEAPPPPAPIGTLPASLHSPRQATTPPRTRSSHQPLRSSNKGITNDKLLSSSADARIQQQQQQQQQQSRSSTLLTIESRLAVLSGCAQRQYEVLRGVIFVVQNCVGVSSADCKKQLSLLLSDIPSDPMCFVAAAFIHSFRPTAAAAAMSNSATATAAAANTYATATATSVTASAFAQASSTNASSHLLMKGSISSGSGAVNQPSSPTTAGSYQLSPTTTGSGTTITSAAVANTISAVVTTSTGGSSTSVTGPSWWNIWSSSSSSALSSSTAVAAGEAVAQIRQTPQKSQAPQDVLSISQSLSQVQTHAQPNPLGTSGVSSVSISPPVSTAAAAVSVSVSRDDFPLSSAALPLVPGTVPGTVPAGTVPSPSEQQELQLQDPETMGKSSEQAGVDQRAAAAGGALSSVVTNDVATVSSSIQQQAIHVLDHISDGRYSTDVDRDGAPIDTIDTRGGETVLPLSLSPGNEGTVASSSGDGDGDAKERVVDDAAVEKGGGEKGGERGGGGWRSYPSETVQTPPPPPPPPQSQSPSPRHEVLPASVSTAVVAPRDIASFLEWFCADDRRPMRDDLMWRLQRALSSVQRRADKLRSRAQQQRATALRTALQRQEKHKSALQRATSECLLKVSVAVEGIQVSFEGESESWVSQLIERIKIGKERFNEYIEDAVDESSSLGKDSSTSTTNTAAATTTPGTTSTAATTTATPTPAAATSRVAHATTDKPIINLKDEDEISNKTSQQDDGKDIGDDDKIASQVVDDNLEGVGDNSYEYDGNFDVRTTLRSFLKFFN